MKTEGAANVSRVFRRMSWFSNLVTEGNQKQGVQGSSGKVKATMVRKLLFFFFNTFFFNLMWGLNS